MPFNLNQFRSSFSSSGEPASVANFEVRILTAPKIISQSVSRDLVFRAQTASIPGKTLATIERKTYGPFRKVAYGSIYEDITISFIVSNNLQERNYFSVWQTLISDPSKNGDVSYYDEYIGTIQIVAYDDEGNETLLLQLNEAYPIRVAPIQLSWDSKEYMRIDVDFAYHHWKDIISNKRNSFNDLINAVSSGIALASSVKSLSQIGKTATSGNLGGLVAGGAAIANLASGVGNAVSNIKKLLGGSASGGGAGELRGNLGSGLAPFINKSGGGGGISGIEGGVVNEASKAADFRSKASTLVDTAISKVKGFF